MRFLKLNGVFALAFTALSGALAQPAPQVVLLPREELMPSAISAPALPGKLRNPALKRLTYLGMVIRLEVAQVLLEQFVAKKDVRVICGSCAGAIFADLRRFGVPMFTVSGLGAQSVLLTDKALYSGGILDGSSAPGLAFESEAASQGYSKAFELMLSKAKRW